MTNWELIDFQADYSRDESATRAAENAIIKAATTAGFIISRDQMGGVYRECPCCGFVAMYSNVEAMDTTPCGCGMIPFSGELNPEDAPESVPGCYGI